MLSPPTFYNEIAPMPRSNVGQDAHVSQAPPVTSKKADITRRTLETACCPELGCWCNNVANSYLFCVTHVTEQ